MEKRFDMMDFEESLREHADRFTLMPSKKVWISIYNDLHPGSKWPSKSISLLLIFSIIMVGNINSGYKTSKPNLLSSSKNKSSNKESLQKPSNSHKSTNTALLLHGVKNISHSTDKSSTEIKQISEGNNLSPVAVNNSANNISDVKESITDLAKNSSPNVISLNTLKPTTIANRPIVVNAPIIEVKTTLIEKGFPKVQNDIIITGLNNQGDLIETSESINAESGLISAADVNINTGDNTKEDKSGAKLLLKKIRKSKWTFYVSPSISSAWFTAAPLSQSSVSNNSPLMVSASNITANRKYNSKLSLSAGATSSLPINDRLNFTSGFKLTYLGYQITSNFIHPTFANLVLKDKLGGTYLKSYITHYGNGLGYGQILLNNYSYQFAIPFGLEYSLIKNQKINWVIGSSIAPSVVLASQSYILSADGRNYVTDPGLGRRFNLLANFETFITFKSAHVKWHIGPALGYQALSTFKNDYPEREHLLDYGLKIGISR